LFESDFISFYFRISGQKTSIFSKKGQIGIILHRKFLQRHERSSRIFFDYDNRDGSVFCPAIPQSGKFIGICSRYEHEDAFFDKRKVSCERSPVLRPNLVVHRHICTGRWI